MRHRNTGKKFARESGARVALLRGLATSLLLHEQVTTTGTRAKELRGVVEPLITRARSVASLVEKGENATAEERGRVVHAIRMARRTLTDRRAVEKLFKELGRRYARRPGGYTRILKVGARRGDAAPVALMQLVVEAGSDPKA